MWKRVSKKKFREAVRSTPSLQVQPWSPYVYFNDDSDWRNVKHVARATLYTLIFHKYWIWEEE